jgi:DNA-directed RNA polymerase specialized sigma subunit
VKDIKQAAQVGIGEAISSVLEHRTQLTKLESVMYFRIRGEVIKTFRTNNMFGSSAFGDVEYEFIKAERKLGAELGHTPTLSDISSELNWSIEETRLIRNGMTYHPGLSARSNPLDRPDTENSVMSNYVPGEVSARGLQELSTEQVVLERLSDEERDRAVTMTAVSALQRTNGISRDILDRYYGFGSYKKPQDAKVIAEEIGMGYENVRQILSRTRRRLRAELQSPYDPSEAEPTNSR